MITEFHGITGNVLNDTDVDVEVVALQNLTVIPLKREPRMAAGRARIRHFDFAQVVARRNLAQGHFSERFPDGVNIGLRNFPGLGLFHAAHNAAAGIQFLNHSVRKGKTHFTRRNRLRHHGDGESDVFVPLFGDESRYGRG